MSGTPNDARGFGTRLAPDELRVFRGEASTLVDAIEAALDPATGAEARNEAARHLHTLKGSAAMAGFPRIAEASHHLEDALSLPGTHLAPHLAHLRAVIRETAAGADSADARTAFDPSHVERATNALRLIDVTIDLPPEWSAVCCFQALTALRSLGKVPASDPTPEAIAELRAGSRFVALFDSGCADSAIRDALALVSGIATTVITWWSPLAEYDDATSPRDHGPDAGTTATTVLEAFAAMVRPAEELAARLGKQLRVTITAPDDILAVETARVLTLAALHIVRNAVVHGIQPADDRRAAGKPPAGTIAIRLLVDEDRAGLTVQDDGEGIDIAAIRGAAVRAGALSLEQALALSADDAARLVFGAGISTAEEVTEDAGRGVGLDAVRAAAETLGGEADVETREGEGTTFRVTVPNRAERPEVTRRVA